MTIEKTQRPSAIGSFFSGGMSGLFSGIVMALIIASIAPFVGVAGATFMGTLAASGPLMVLAATLFGGVMGAKRALFDAPDHANAGVTIVPVPVPGMSTPAMAPVMAMAEDAPEQTQTPTKSWVADTGRSEDSRSRIQQILADGSLTDKDRASAILASRQAADTQPSRT